MTAKEKELQEAFAEVYATLKGGRAFANETNAWAERRRQSLDRWALLAEEGDVDKCAREHVEAALTNGATLADLAAGCFAASNAKIASLKVALSEADALLRKYRYVLPKNYTKVRQELDAALETNKGIL